MSTSTARRRRNVNKSQKVIWTISFQELHQKVKALRYKVHYLPHCKCSKLSHLSSSTEKGDWIVVPEKSPSPYKPQFVFAFQTTAINFQGEENLKQHIFSTEINTNNNPFKISCANCLLENHERNGFLCLHSTNYKKLQSVLRQCRKEISEKNQEQLHHDHAHHICILSYKSLQDLLKEQKSFKHIQKKKTKESTQQHQNHKKIGKTYNHKNNNISTTLKRSTDEIYMQMKRQQIPVTITTSISKTNDSTPAKKEQKQEDDQFVPILFGHHLESLLHIVRKESEIKIEKKDGDYWLVLVYDDTDKKKNSGWALDLPGGKRHLGETSIQCSLRESYEEISFVCQENDFITNWVDRNSNDNTIIRLQAPKEPSNEYFMAQPPQSIQNNKNIDKLNESFQSNLKFSEPEKEITKATNSKSSSLQSRLEEFSNNNIGKQKG